MARPVSRRVRLFALALLALPAVQGPPALRVDRAGETPPAKKVVLFLGTSLTAGFGVDASEAFPGRIRSRIDSAGWPLTVRVAGHGGAMAGGGADRLARLSLLRVEVLVVELGANDALHGMPVGVVRRDLEAVVRQARSRWPDVRVLLAAVRAPPDRPHEYRRRFRQMFRRLAEDQETALAPDILEGVVREKMTLYDGVHPNASGHARIARNLWPRLRPLLREAAAARAHPTS